MTPIEIDKEIDTFCARMSEHVDSILVLVTKPEAGMTAFHASGRGNWYAQSASARHWLKSGDQVDLATKIGECISEE